MGVRVGEQLGPARRVQPHRCLIGHRPSRKEQRALLAQEIGDPLLEPSGRGVAIQQVVADGGVRHRPSHGGGGLCDRVTPQVDHIIGINMTITRRHRTPGPSSAMNTAATTAPAAIHTGRRPTTVIPISVAMSARPPVVVLPSMPSILPTARVREPSASGTDS